MHALARQDAPEGAARTPPPRRRVLTLGKATLLMLGLGTVALMGVPGLGGYVPPEGALGGTVVDERGDALADVCVALFGADTNGLLEITHTDARGRFAFQQAPWSYHLFARPAAGAELAGAWSLSRDTGPTGELELVLPPGHPVTIVARDERGAPVAGAEVRVVDARDETVVVQRTQTDAEGIARVLAPERAHLGVLGAGVGLLSTWAFDRELSGGETLALTLPGGAPLSGRVVDDVHEPLLDVLVSSWDLRADEWHWNGYRRTAADGGFTIPGASGETVLRFLDRTQAHLPLGLVARASEGGQLSDVVLPTGHPLRVRCAASGDDGPASRVWVWSRETSSWSWGTRTDSRGVLEARVSAHHAVVAEPLHGAAPAREAWGLSYEREELDLATQPTSSAAAPDADE